jgi:hypothetical protein
MDTRTTRIWAGLVSYANATINTVVVEAFRRTVMDCVSWVAVVDPMSGLKWASEEDDAVKYQPSIRALLRSLCSNLLPHEREHMGRQSTSFVGEHTRHIEWRLFEVVYSPYVQKELQDLNFTPAEVEKISEMYKRYWAAYKRGDPTFNMQIPSKDYQDFADPICDFVLSEYQRHRDKEYSRRDKKPAP